MSQKQSTNLNFSWKKKKHKTVTKQTKNNKGWKVNEPNVKSVSECSWDEAPVWSRSALSPWCLLCSSSGGIFVTLRDQASSKQRLPWHLLFWGHQMWKVQCLESLTVHCKSPSFLKEFNQSWTFAGLLWLWLSVLVSLACASFGDIWS